MAYYAHHTSNDRHHDYCTAFAGRNVMVGILGVIFTAMALFNVGCCGSNGCIPNKKSTNNPNEFTYEEVV